MSAARWFSAYSLQKWRPVLRSESPLLTSLRMAQPVSTPREIPGALRPAPKGRVGDRGGRRGPRRHPRGGSRGVVVPLRDSGLLRDHCVRPFRLLLTGASSSEVDNREIEPPFRFNRNGGSGIKGTL